MPKKRYTTTASPGRRRRAKKSDSFRLVGLRPHPAPADLGPPAHRSRSAPIVVAQDTDFATPVVLLGRCRLGDPRESVCQAWVLELPCDCWDAISAFDFSPAPPPSWLARACHALWRAGLRLTEIREALQLSSAVSEIQRFVRAATADDYVLRMLDRGALRWGHMRTLGTLAPAEQRFWAEQVVARKLSSRALALALQGPQRSNPDDAHFERVLAEGLQADALRLTPRAPAGYTLEIAWTWLPTLQTVFERLGQAPFADNADALPHRARSLVIEVDTLDELDALAGHLTRSEP